MDSSHCLKQATVIPSTPNSAAARPGRSGDRPARFLVGQDDAGHWLAVEAHGLGGGVFVSREAALHYVGFETGHDPRACLVSKEPIGFGFTVPASAPR